MRSHHCCAIQLNTIILLSSSLSLSISTPSAYQEKNPQEKCFPLSTALQLSLSYFLENSENEISTAIV
jgi:heme/copper-type cytochrome/quinol oxidase subunit 3